MRRRWWWPLTALAVVASACSGSEATSSLPNPTVTSGAPPGSVSPFQGPDITKVPDLDTSDHSVPLEEIVFDTFQGSAIPLTEASQSLILDLRDAIRPIYNPVYETPAETDEWLNEDARVIGYTTERGAYAYPAAILDFHEIVNETLDDVPLVITYCPLCGSGIVYRREVDGQVLLFGNTSALYESDLVMYDHQTGSYWHQVLGEVIAGPLTGTRLPLMPSMTTTWSQWKTLFPQTRVLSARSLGPVSRYQRDPFAGYESTVNSGFFPFPVRQGMQDRRLPLGAHVLTVQVEGQQKAYPLERLGDAVVNDTVGNTPVVIFSQVEGPGGTAFLPQAGGRSNTDL